MLIACALWCTMAQSDLPPLIPRPQSVRRTQGDVRLTQQLQIVAEGPVREVAKQLRSILGFGTITNSKGPRFSVVLRLDNGLSNLGDEGYKLTVAQDGIYMRAHRPSGLFHGVQTLRQLLPPEIETKKAGVSWAVPCVQIVDQPRFGWRGMHLDVSRHFFPAEQIKRYIDHLALLKLNTFHWHLIDDGGWRVEIKKYPDLTRVGAWRVATDKWSQRALDFPGPDTDQKLYGGFYTQNQVRDIVKYAQDRFITVVPEIEMPGHTMPSIAAYPRLACADYDAEEYYARSGNKLANVYCAGREETFAFIESVLDEVLDLFPSKFIHVGGDEVDKYLWTKCKLCQDRIKAEGLKDEHELQSYFIRRIEKYLNAHGRRLIGWDEILEGGLAPNASVMSWRGITGGIAAAKAGHDVVMSPTTPCYFDYSYNDNSTRRVFEYDPVPEELSEDEGRHVLGVQANVWTEWIPTWRRVEEMVFPRILGLAETAWIGRGNRSWDEFDARVSGFIGRLNAIGAQYMLPVPVPEYSAVFLSGEASVAFRGFEMPGIILRYTLDSSVPNASSPAYEGPITVTKPCIIRAAYVTPNGRAGEVVDVQCVLWERAGEGILASGLIRSVYSGTWSAVPDFSKLTPASQGAVQAIDLAPLKGTENYAMLFRGFIRIPVDGAYTFSTESDDGSWLKLGGVTVVPNDGLHPMLKKSGKVLLKEGLMPIEIGFFQQGGADGLKVTIAGPGIEEQPLPSKWLFRRE